MTPAERRAAIRSLRALADALEAEEKTEGRPLPPKRRRFREPTAADHELAARALRKAGVEP